MTSKTKWSKKSFYPSAALFSRATNDDDTGCDANLANEWKVIDNVLKHFKLNNSWCLCFTIFPIYILKLSCYDFAPCPDDVVEVRWNERNSFFIVSLCISFISSGQNEVRCSSLWGMKKNVKNGCKMRSKEGGDFTGVEKMKIFSFILLFQMKEIDMENISSLNGVSSSWDDRINLR